jgi:hypothetical protein
MLLDIQTIHLILKKYSSSKCKQTVCLHYRLDFHFNIKSHKKRLGILNVIPRNQTMYCIQIPKGQKTEADVEIKNKMFPDFRFS